MARQGRLVRRLQMQRAVPLHVRATTDRQHLRGHPRLAHPRRTLRLDRPVGAEHRRAGGLHRQPLGRCEGADGHLHRRPRECRAARGDSGHLGRPGGRLDGRVREPRRDDARRVDGAHRFRRGGRPVELARRDPRHRARRGAGADRADDVARQARASPQRAGRRGGTGPGRHLGRRDDRPRRWLRLQMGPQRQVEQAFPVRLERARPGLSSVLVLASLVRRERMLVGAGLLALTLLSWLYLVLLADAMDAMRGAGGHSAFMWLMPMGRWGATAFALCFAMWVVMMIAMMVPSAAPMLFAFHALSQSRAARERTDRRFLAFLLGYFVVWSGFSLVATVAQWALHEAAMVTDLMTSA